MNSKLAFRYDREGDILYIDTCPAYSEQESAELSDEVVVRLNPGTGAIENVEAAARERIDRAARQAADPADTKIGKTEP